MFVVGAGLSPPPPSTPPPPEKGYISSLFSLSSVSPTDPPLRRVLEETEPWRELYSDPWREPSRELAAERRYSMLFPDVGVSMPRTDPGCKRVHV